MTSAVVAPSNSPVISPSIFCRTPPFSPLTTLPSPPPPFPPPLTLRPRVGVVPCKDRGGSSALERKRPPMIAIPTGFTVEAVDVAPERAKEEDEVEEEGDRYGVYSKRGKKRGRLEDRYSAVHNLQGDCDQAFFGVFDGHGGPRAAEFAARNIDKNIMENIKRRNISKSGIEEAVRSGYLKTDEEFIKEDVSGGSCCVTALIREGDLIVSNAGDCRAVLSRGGNAEALTSDHKASVESERNRIEELNGYVDCCNGVWRIQGCLAVSRGIGDKHLKPLVVAEPETKVLQIRPDDEFLILASDGLWDKVTNQEAVDTVRPLLDKLTPFLAAKKLAQLSVRRGSADDVTVLIVKLDQFI